jgi:hypothetical protein
MTSHELWEVMLSSGQILTVTLDQLDQGFADGHVTETTLVRAFGTLEWSTLADLAGLEGDEAPATVRDLAPPIVVGVASVNGSKPGGTLRLHASASAYAIAPPIVVGAKARSEVVPASPARSEPALSRTTPAAFTAPSFPPSAYDLTVDVDLSEISGSATFASPFAPKKKPVAIYAAIAGACMVVLAAVGFVSSAEGPAAAANAVTANANANANVGVTQAASPSAPVEVVQPASEALPTVQDVLQGPKLSEAQKAAVLEADKKLAKKKNAKKAAPSTKKPAKDPFSKGGSPHDPLNKSL